MKPGTLIIIVSMAIIAFCAGFVMTFVVGLPALASAALSLAILAVLAVAQFLVTLIAERRRVADQLHDLSETAGHCMRQVTAVTQRLDDLHSDVSERIDGETREMREELTLVANAVRELADVMEDRFDEQVEIFDEPAPISPIPAIEPIRPKPVAPRAQSIPVPEPIQPRPVAQPTPTIPAMEPIQSRQMAQPTPAIPTMEPIQPTPVQLPPQAYQTATIAAPVYPTATVVAPVYATATEPPPPSTGPGFEPAPRAADPGIQAYAEPAAAPAVQPAIPTAQPMPAPRFEPTPQAPEMQAERQAAPQAPQPAPVHNEFGAHALYSDAIKEGRADMFLQPIVALPQRHVQFYEAITKVRTLTAGLVEASEYRPAIARHDTIVDLDIMTLSRALKISARLSQRGRSVQIFMPVSLRALVSQRFITDAQRLLHDNRGVAANLVLQFDHAELAEIGPVEDEAMATLADAGPRFALDNARDFRFDPQDLARRRFRYIRIEAATLFSGKTLSPDIHPADFSGLVQRFTMRLIATGVTQERTVPDLLDYHVPYALGDLFSVPRPVRSDILSDPDGTANARRASA